MAITTAIIGQDGKEQQIDFTTHPSDLTKAGVSRNMASPFLSYPD